MSYLDENGLSYLISKIKANFLTSTDLNGYLALNGGSSNYKTSGDLNSFQTGICLFASDGTTVSNCPISNVSATWLIIASGDGSREVQLAYPIISEAIPLNSGFVRYKVNNTWSSWSTIGDGALSFESSVEGYEGTYGLKIASDASAAASGWITFVV